MVKVLVVDDAADASESIGKFLEVSGHQVSTVPNGREALISVPEMDGPSFLEVIRSYLRLQSLPVVVLTALSDSPMIERVQTLKVNSVLVKGKASPDDIRKAVDEAAVRAPG